MTDRINLMVFADYYLPGFKAGGPVASISNLIKKLHSNHKLTSLVITRNREASSKEKFNLKSNKQIRIEDSYAFYMDGNLITHIASIFRLIKQNKCPIYLNSLYSLKYSFLPLLINKIFFKRKVYISPRGELARSAISTKFFVKTLYLYLWRGLFSFEALFFASSQHELKDIQRFSKKINAVILPNISSFKMHSQISDVFKEREKLKIIFISRITPIKNIEFIFKVLSKCKRKFQFDIYGPIRDEAYWKDITNGINIFNFKGPINPLEIPNIIRKYHLFFLPTKGENFGHAILEALGTCTPVLISDQTPWRGLYESRVGADLSLDSEKEFVEYVEKFNFEYDADDFKNYLSKFNQDQYISTYFKIFTKLQAK